MIKFKIGFFILSCFIATGCSSRLVDLKFSTSEEYTNCIKNTPTLNCEYLKK